MSKYEFWFVVGSQFGTQHAQCACQVTFLQYGLAG